MKRRLLALILTSALILTMLPATAAAVVDTLDIGAAGTYAFTEDGLNDAIADASAGDTIKFMESGTLTLANTITINKSITLDLNGQTVDLNFLSDFRYLTIPNGYSLTVKGPGTITTNTHIDVKNTATLTVQGGAAIEGYGVWQTLINYGTVSMTDGALRQTNGKFVFQHSGTAILDNVTIENSANESVIWAANGTLTLNNCTTKNNYVGTMTGTNPSVILVSSSCALTLNGGFVTGPVGSTLPAIQAASTTTYANNGATITNGYVKKLGDLSVSVSSGAGKVTLAPQTMETGVTYYYKTTAADDTAGKPSYDTAFNSAGWTAFSAATDIATASTATVYVQVVKVGDLEQKIYGWGQGSAAPMVIDTEAELNAAILAVEENGTVALGGNITLADTLNIGGTKSFTIDLKGFTLDFDAADKEHGVIYFTGTGTLAITDSSTGGKLQANYNGTVESNGSGKIIIRGNASIISTESVPIIITGGTAESDVLEIAGGTVSGAASTRAILNVGDGDITVSGGMITAGNGIECFGSGNVTVSGGTVNALYHAILANGNVILSGGTMEGSIKAINCIDPGQITICGGTLVLKSNGGAMNKAPDLSGYTSYYWRTSNGGKFTSSATAPYVWEAGHTYVEIKPYIAPAPGGGGYVPPAPATVYNDPSKPSATIWLSGTGLNGNDLLVTQAITSGSDYNAMLKLADKDDIFRVYDISLKSGKASTGSAMYLTFDLDAKYNGQAFTLVHQKADGTFEYFHATASADGNLKFGPLYELSPFMLVKGSIISSTLVDLPQTGDSGMPLFALVLLFAAACGLSATVYRKKHTQA